MKPQSRDTDLAAEQVQLSLLRKAGSAGRFAVMQSLTATGIALSCRAIRRANPDMTPRELDLRFVELHYGHDLADRLRRHLEERDRCEQP
jgi:hypothetical protein